MRGLLAAMLIFAPAATVHAQLGDVTQTEPNVPGGMIGKSLQQQIRAGRGDEFTPGSSLYLIARDPSRTSIVPAQVHDATGPASARRFSHGDIMAQPAFGADL